MRSKLHENAAMVNHRLNSYYVNQVLLYFHAKNGQIPIEDIVTEEGRFGSVVSKFFLQESPLGSGFAGVFFPDSASYPSMSFL